MNYANCFYVFQTTFCKKMKHRKPCIQDAEGQKHEGIEGKICACENTQLYYSGSGCEGQILHLLSQLVCCLF